MLWYKYQPQIIAGRVKLLGLRYLRPISKM